MQVCERLISNLFFMIKSTFFDIKTDEHINFTSSSISWWFHFFLKSGDNMAISFPEVLHCQLVGGE